MSRPPGLEPVVLLATAGVLLALAARALRAEKGLVDLTVAQIEEQVLALDPVTRAAVIARLTSDAARAAKDQAHS